MNQFKYLLCVGILICGTAAAQQTPASEESIRALLEMTDARNVVDGVYAQFGELMKRVEKDALEGRPVSTQQQAVFDRFKAKAIAILKEEMSWEKLLPDFVQLYRDTLTQDEINGIVDFYKTPAGQAMIKKMPLLVQNSMTMMQKKMVPLSKKMGEAGKEMGAQLKALKKN